VFIVIYISEFDLQGYPKLQSAFSPQSKNCS